MFIVTTDKGKQFYLSFPLGPTSSNATSRHREYDGVVENQRYHSVRQILSSQWLARTCSGACNISKKYFIIFTIFGFGMQWQNWIDNPNLKAD